jgi:DNA invertase Pin-like site-specific DNA recombinase
MLDRIAGNGVRTIIVESPDRFARDLTVQLTGHDFLKNLGISLIPATPPDFFTEDTPTAVLVRQALGAIGQFEKSSLVAKLKAARDRKIAAGEKCGGRKSYAERDPGHGRPGARVAWHRWPPSFVAHGFCRPRQPRLCDAKRKALFGVGRRFDAS